MFAIKAEVGDPRAEAFAFSEQTTMYGGKHITAGNMIFVSQAKTRVVQV
jgi:hypothetical protein